MGSPVNIIKVTKNEGSIFLGPYRLLIDRRDLVDWINDLCLKASKTPWADKSRAYLDIDKVVEGAKQSGQFEILICANCASAGYRSCADIGLAPIQVKQTGDSIEWTVSCPDQKGIKSDVQHTFRFDRKQFIKALSRFAKKEAS